MGIVIRAQQIAHEHRVMREALVSKLVQAQVQRWGSAVAHIRKIAFQAGAAECFDHFLGQSLEFGVLLTGQIKARKFVVPRTIWKPLHRAAVDLFLLGTQTVLCEKDRQALIEAGIIGVAVDLPTKNRQRSGNLLQLNQSRQVAL